MRWGSRTWRCPRARSGSGARRRACREERAMYDFEYHRPSGLADAVALRAKAADGAYLAGGMTLIPTLKQRQASPSDLIDLGALPGMDAIAVEGERLVVGAMARHAAV